MTDQIKTLAADISSRFLAGLKGIQPSAEELAIIQRSSERLDAAGLDAIGADAATQQSIKEQTALDLSTMANLAVSAEIDAEQLARQSAQQALTEALAVAIKVVIAAA